MHALLQANCKKKNKGAPGQMQCSQHGNTWRISSLNCQWQANLLLLMWLQRQKIRCIPAYRQMPAKEKLNINTILSIRIGNISADRSIYFTSRLWDGPRNCWTSSIAFYFDLGDGIGWHQEKLRFWVAAKVCPVQAAQGRRACHEHGQSFQNIHHLFTFALHWVLWLRGEGVAIRPIPEHQHIKISQAD